MPEERDCENLLEKYGLPAKVSLVSTGMTGQRYRYRPLTDTPGIWISMAEARKLLEAEQERQRSDSDLLNYDAGV